MKNYGIRLGPFLSPTADEPMKNNVKDIELIL